MSITGPRPFGRTLTRLARPAGRVLASRLKEQPIFVVGPGRSGTSVLKDAIGAHPDVVAALGESPFARIVGRAAADLDDAVGYRRTSLRTAPEDADDLMRRLIFETAMGPAWGARRVVRAALAARGVPSRWCAKTFPDSHEAHGLLRLFPRGRFVYIVRDGAAVVRSRTRFAPMRDIGFAEHCREWAGAIERYAYLRQHPAAVTVRHETLVADPRGELARVVAFLGLSADDAPGRFAERTLVVPSQDPGEASASVREHLTERPPPAAGWTEEERATFARICGDAMRTLGYEVPA